MRLTVRTTMVMGFLALGGLLMLASQAHASGCGGGGCGGGVTSGGRMYSRVYSAGYGCRPYCTMGGMNMGGMQMPAANMQGMNAGAAPIPAAGMQGMNMPGASAPSAAPTAAAASRQYYCPMHPSVMSTFPATCPYCGMALRPR